MLLQFGTLSLLKIAIIILEGVHRPARRVCLKVGNVNTYSDMLDFLKPPKLDTRRKTAKLSLMYKIVNLTVFPESSALLRIQPVHNPYSTHYTHNLYVSDFVFILSQHTYL